jgi:hypothetical protein
MIYAWEYLFLNYRMVKQKRFYAFISIMVFGIILLGSCKADKKLQYVVKTPANWVREDGFTPEGWKKSVLKPQKGDTLFYSGENIIITCFKVKNIDESVREFCIDVQGRTVLYNEEKREKLNVNGFDARFVQMVVSYRSHPGIIVEQKTYFIKDKGTLFMVICTAQRKGIEKLQPIMDEVLASFKTEEDK